MQLPHSNSHCNQCTYSGGGPAVDYGSRTRIWSAGEQFINRPLGTLACRCNTAVLCRRCAAHSPEGRLTEAGSRLPVWPRLGGPRVLLDCMLLGPRCARRQLVLRGSIGSAGAAPHLCAGGHAVVATVPVQAHMVSSGPLCPSSASLCPHAHAPVCKALTTFPTSVSLRWLPPRGGRVHPALRLGSRSACNGFQSQRALHVSTMLLGAAAGASPGRRASPCHFVTAAGGVESFNTSTLRLPAPAQNTRCLPLPAWLPQDAVT
jgi:hypothetical protein